MYGVSPQSSLVGCPRAWEKTEASGWVEGQTKTGNNLRNLEGKKLQCTGIPKRGNWARGDKECGSAVLQRPEFQVRGVAQSLE